VSEAISVTAEVPLVNTSFTRTGRTIENAEITNLPLVNRNVYALLDITPGVGATTQHRPWISGTKER